MEQSPFLSIWVEIVYFLQREWCSQSQILDNTPHIEADILYWRDTEKEAFCIQAGKLLSFHSYDDSSSCNVSFIFTFFSSVQSWREREGASV